jgi:hypothetical protein
LKKAKNYVQCLVMSMFKEHRLIAKMRLDDFYVTRSLPAPITSIKESPIAPIGIAADIAHRTFKVGSDILRLLQGESRQPLQKLDGSFAPRTTEATFGAVQNGIGGIIDIFRGKLLAGPARIVQGGLDIIDIPVSIAADIATTSTGVRYRSASALQQAA